MKKEWLWVALCACVLACGWRDGDGEGAPRAGLSEGPAGPVRGVSIEPPEGDGPAVTVDVGASKGQLTAAMALPALPTRAGLDPRLTLTYDGSNVDFGSGFGAGFSLSVPAISVGTEVGLTLPHRADGDPFSTPLSYDGHRLVFIGAVDADVLAYRPEASESALRVYYYKTPGAIAAVGGETLQFRGFLVVHADGTREVYSDDPDVAEYDVFTAGDAQYPVPTRFPLQYRIAPSGDYVAYRYTHDKEDDRSYLTSVIFAGGRSRYDFQLERLPRPPDRPVYDQGFAQRQTHLYTAAIARFDDAVVHRTYFVYRTSDGAEARLFHHADVRGVVEAELGIDRSNVPLSEESVLLGVLRYGADDGAPIGAATPRRPSIRFARSDRTLPALRAQTRVQTIDIRGVAGFGESGGAEFVDVDQDGLTDVVATNAAGTETSVYRNEGSVRDGSFQSAGRPLTVRRAGESTAIVPSFRGVDNVWLPGDFNGDGVFDLLQIERGSAEEGGSRLTLYPGQIGGDAPYAAARAPFASPRDLATFRDGKTQAVDLNADGRDDLLSIVRRDGRWRIAVLLNLTKSEGQPGGGSLSFADIDGRLEPPPMFDQPALLGVDFGLDKPENRLTDVNGDGLTDLTVVRLTDAGEKGVCVFENRGAIRANVDTGVVSAKELTLFGDPSSTSGTCPGGTFVEIDPLPSISTVNALWLIDVNGDGLSDLINVGERADRLAFWAGRGREGFRYQGEIPLDAPLRVDPTNRWNTRVLDLDGDGQEEIVVYDREALHVVDFNRVDGQNLTAPLLLTEVREGKGIRHVVQYATSTDELLRDRAQGRPDAPGVPVVTPVVKRLLSQVGDAPVSVTDMRYHDPVVDRVERGLLGFSEAEIATHGDAHSEGAHSRIRFDIVGDRFRDRLFADRERSRVVSALVADAASSALIAAIDAAPRDAPASPAFVTATEQTRRDVPFQLGGRLSSTDTRWESDVTVTPARAPVYLRAAHTEVSRYGALCTGDCQASTETHDFRYDDCNRVSRDDRVAAAVAAPDGVTIPARRDGTVTVYEVACATEPKGRGDALSLTSPRSTTRTSSAGRLLEQRTYTYRPGVPFVPSSVTITGSIDKSHVSAEAAAAIAAVPARTEHYDYDAYLSRTATFDQPAGGSEPKALIERTERDATGVRVVALENGLGHRESFAFTPGFLAATQVTTARGEQQTLRYDALQRLTRSSKSDGTTVVFDYREADASPLRRVRVSERRSKDEVDETLFVERADGLPIARVEPGEDGRVRVVDYTTYGRGSTIARTWTPFLVAATVAGMLDARDAPWQPTGPGTCGDGKVACTRSDGLDRVVERQAASGRYRERTRFEAWGEQTEVTDESGTRARRTVSRDEDVFAVIDELSHVHAFDRDEAEQLVAVRLAGEADARKVVTDSLGRVLYTAIPHGMSKVFTRDHRARVVREEIFDRRQRSGGLLRTVYDALDRQQVRESFADGAASKRLDRHVFAYDGPAGGPDVGSLVRATIEDDLAHSTFDETFAHDRDGQLIEREATYTAEGVRRAYRESWRYAFDGLLTVHTDPFGNQIDYDHTPSGRVRTMRWRNGERSAVLASATAFDDFGSAERLALPVHGLAQTLRHDRATGLLIGQQTCRTDGADCLQTDDFPRRGDGRVTGRTAKAARAAYGFTARGELASMSGEAGRIAYERDAAGHWLRFGEASFEAFTRSERPVALPDGWTTDDFGRIASGGGAQVLSYDPEGRLRSATVDGARVVYAYSALGERIARRVDGTPSLVVYPTPETRDDGQERQRIVVYEPRPIALIVGQEPKLGLLSDQRGVVEGLVGPGGAAAMFASTPYGNLTPAQPAVAGLASLELASAFTGSLRDDDTGLVHMGAREYAPALGSFTTPDPLFQSDPGLCATRLLECAPYGYAAHDPIDLVDPDGTAALSARAVQRATMRISRLRATGRAYRPAGRMASSLLMSREQSSNASGNVFENRRTVQKSSLSLERSTFLGPGAVKVDKGKWRSADGARQFRVKPNDYRGQHGNQGPHVHMEILRPNATGTKLKVVKNVHIPLR